MALFEKNVDQIVAVFTKAVSELNQREETCLAEAMKTKDKMDMLQGTLFEQQREAVRARTLSRKLTDLVA